MESETVPSQFKAKAHQEVDIYNDSFSEDSFQIEDDINELPRGVPHGVPDTLNKTSTESSPMLGGAGSGSSKKTSELTVIKQQEAPAVSRPQSVHEDSEDISSEEEEEDADAEEDADEAQSDGGSHKSSKSSRSSSSAASTTSTTSLLANDPLFIVLSQYLSNKDGNIVDALYKINKTLKKIYAKMP